LSGALLVGAFGGVYLVGEGHHTAPTSVPTTNVGNAHKIKAKPVPRKTVHAKPTDPAPANTPAPTPTTMPAPQTQFTNAVSVLDQFYQDITDHNYAAAWALGGDNIGGQSYSSWVAGYQDTTASITLYDASAWGSDQVQAYLSATQLDGTVRTYQGTYTVSNGVIVSANIVQTG
jgi:hypothetical protein